MLGFPGGMGAEPAGRGSLWLDTSISIPLGFLLSYCQSRGKIATWNHTAGKADLWRLNVIHRCSNLPHLPNEKIIGEKSPWPKISRYLHFSFSTLVKGAGLTALETNGLFVSKEQVHRGQGEQRANPCLPAHTAHNPCPPALGESPFRGEGRESRLQ